MKKKEPLERFSAVFRKPACFEQPQSGRRNRSMAARASVRLMKLGASLPELCTGATTVLMPIAALMYSGCAGVSNPLLSSGPHPRVEDCALIQQATPTRYICNGKIYTSVQLDEISRGEQVQISEQAAQGALPGNVITPTGNFGTYPQSAVPASGSGVH